MVLKMGINSSCENWYEDSGDILLVKCTFNAYIYNYALGKSTEMYNK